MKLIILSDIHSHSRALTYVRDKFGGEQSEYKFCILGDVVGYGPDPVGCLEILKDLDDHGKIYRDEQGRPAMIGGNHEEAWFWCEEQGYASRLKEMRNLSSQRQVEAIVRLVNNEILTAFSASHSYYTNKHALVPLLLNIAEMQREASSAAIEWYRSIIRRNGYGPLEFPGVDHGQWDLVLAHGTYDKPLDGELLPCNPEEPDEVERYVHEQKNGNRNRKILLHGHTHVPLYFNSNLTPQPDLDYNQELVSQNAEVTVINPGSLGLPRDRDRRPSMAILELADNSLKTTFLRDLQADFHQQHIEDLEKCHYPQRIVGYVRNAPMKYEKNENCRKFLRRRAGDHWISNEE